MARFLRYEKNGTARYGELKGNTIHPLDGEFGAFRPSSDPTVELDEVSLLAPCVPSKIIAVGPNCHTTLRLRGMPVPERPAFWLKPSTTLNHPEGYIELPQGWAHDICNHEVELGTVIGKKAKDVPESEALDYIFGYTCVNEVCAADFGTPGAFAMPIMIDGKTFDTFAPLGPWIVTDLDTRDLAMICRVNGEVRQNDSTRNFIFPPAKMVAMASAVMTLLPGDVISSGSVPGLTHMRAGDVIEIEIENIGVLRNYVRDRASRGS
jgi:2-keto-4-pentenoate hydratase/2-oxohepta-3-ene-1,7-dioic acid hydratase in catechol pathway